MPKRWVLKEQGDTKKIESLAKQLNINDILAGLLVQRSVTSFEEAKRFFRPDIAHLHDPFLMQDMNKAIDRIKKAIANEEKILIYGDYDVDGTTSVALVFSFFNSFYKKIGYYLPDRYKEGYGISVKGIEWAKENGYSLIIALDCGIKANAQMEVANNYNIDFIICDHHIPGDSLPKAVAILDPKRFDCSYPYKDLSGCGIGFKLIQAYAQNQDIPFAELEKYLDLVAVSIAADIVPITGENRILTYYGLQWLNKNPRPGIKAILELSNFKKQLTVSDIVFTIGPRINAAGRIEDARKAVELLIAANQEIANDAGKNINGKNIERRAIDISITEHALKMVTQDKDFANKKTTVLFHPEWHKGVIGIVASRLTEKYYRPTVILTQSNGLVTGSARSVKDFDIYNAIEECNVLLEQYGGHKYAAGLTLKLENLTAFQQKFEEVVSSTIAEHLLVQEIEIDAIIKLNDITPSFYKILKQLGPFGPGNMTPVFKSEGVFSDGYAKIVGKNHLKLRISSPEKISYDAIAFQFGSYFHDISKNRFDICYTIEENLWQGETSLQLNVKDIKML